MPLTDSPEVTNPILARLASLRAVSNKDIASNLSIPIKDRKPFPLKEFLLLVTKADSECYVNYHEGAIALVKWLAPIELPVAKYPAIEYKFPIPGLLNSYWQERLAYIISTHGQGKEEASLEERNEWYRAVLLVMFHEVLPELYPDLKLLA